MKNTPENAGDLFGERYEEVRGAQDRLIEAEIRRAQKRGRVSSFIASLRVDRAERALARSNGRYDKVLLAPIERQQETSESLP